MKIYNQISDSIGGTPLVHLQRLGKGCPGVIFAKLESRNPTFSVKCRIGAAMISDAEDKKLLIPGSKTVSVVEATSGNTGIALASVCAAKGYPLTLTMPESMSQERRAMLRAFGAKLVLTPAPLGMRGAIEKAEELLKGEPDNYWMPRQFENPANPAIHERTTGPEIWLDTDGQVDVLVSGIGTGGTITGCGRYLKKQNPAVRLIGVEPQESAVLTAIRAGQKPEPKPHLIQGIGAGFKPSVLDLDLVDEILCIPGNQAIETAGQLHREEGITGGISCGAALAAAMQVASRKDMAGKRIVVILPDSGERYLSTALFQDLPQ